MLVNRSKKPLPFELLDSSERGLGRLDDHGVMLMPRSTVTLGARESAVIEITFAPKRRVLPFTEDLIVR